jgi:LysR family glycine cleavage system transcriptional activator
MTLLLSRRFIPPIGCLVAFEAAARHGSFTRAAEELSLTQGAISRQIGQLEGQLGVVLFQRVRQRVALTPAGRHYANCVRETLTGFAAATAQTIAHSRTDKPLRDAACAQVLHQSVA